MPKKKPGEDNDSEMDIESEAAKQFLSPKQKVYKIFDDIQTSLDKKENLSDFYEIYEDISINEFITILDYVFGMILTQYDKNTVPLKNIREFLKKFLEKCVKNSKLKKKNTELINHYCELFTKSAKKNKFKVLCIYFLNCFLSPYSTGNVLLYKSNSLESIKLYLLNILRGKQTFLITLVLQLLSKVPNLLKENEIWERLEILINGPNKSIKKEIIRLFELNNEDILKYLVKMYDDDSTEIRIFAYEKLSKSRLFHTVDSRNKVKIFYIGLSDQNEKIREFTKRILKFYLMHLEILKSNKSKDDNNKMDLEEGSKNGENNNQEKEKEKDENKNKEMDEESININSTAKEKIEKINSPIQNIGKKLKDSPSRIFDELDVSSYYNHPVYSYVYPLITQHMIELIDKDVIIEYCRNIMYNLKSTVLNQNLDMGNTTSFEKRRKSWNSQFTSSNVKGANGYIDKFALFSDLFFYQNILFCLSQQKENEIFKNDILDLLPDETTFCKIMTNFYLINPNIYILHQLLIVSQYIPYQDEVGNREFIEFIHKFISDISLVNKKITDFQFKRKLSFNQGQDDEDDIDIDKINYLEEYTEDKETEITINNYLLNSNRKIICSMEDLVDYALNILKRIYRGKQNELFREIMSIVSELKDTVEDRPNEGGASQNIQSQSSEYKTIKQKENEILEKTKEKFNVIEQIEDDIKRGKGNRIDLQMQLNNENKLLEDMDNQMQILTKMEESTLYRMNILCKFVINNCNKLPFAQFSNMVQQLIVPSLKRTTFPRVVQSALENTGILAIIHYNTVFKNFLKLFFDNVQRDDTNKFSGVIRISLAILLDSCLINNLLELPENVIGGSVVEKIDMIVDKYLYNKNYDARVLAFMGICKMLLANKFNPPEYLLSRLFVCLYRSYQITDKESEDYNIKISEIMNNFMYFYSIEGENHIRAIIHAIEIILTSQLYFQNEFGNDKNLLGHYAGTKYDFLNKFLYIIFQNAQKKLKNANYIRLIFRIFKYVYFLFKYVKEEDVANEEYDTGRIRTRHAIKEEKEKREKKEKEKKEKEKKEKESQEKEGNTETENKEEKPKKTIEITTNLIRLISNRANSFLDKNDIDQAVFEFYKSNDDFGKMFALMLVMDEIGLLSQFSKYFADRMDEFKEKKYIFDINGTTHDYSTEESQNRLREYVSKSETKYYALIEGAYNYCLNLKSIKIDDKRDNTKIIEDYDEEESDNDEGDDDQKSKSSNDLDNKEEEKEEEKDDKEDEKEKNNKEENSDEESQEKEKEKEKNNKKKKNSEEEEDEYEEENDNEDDDEESKNDKKKSNKNSRKKKAEEMKPKQKKSKTYKNKKK